MISIALDTLDYILRCGKRKTVEIPLLSGNKFKPEIIKYDGYKYLCQIFEKNEGERNDILYQKSRNLIMEYFADDKIPKYKYYQSISQSTVSEFNDDNDITPFARDIGFKSEDFKMVNNKRYVYRNVSDLFGERAEAASMIAPMSFGAVNELFPVEALIDNGAVGIVSVASANIEIRSFSGGNNRSAVIQLIDDILLKFE
eukprot:UN13274